MKLSKFELALSAIFVIAVAITAFVLGELVQGKHDVDSAFKSHCPSAVVDTDTN